MRIIGGKPTPLTFDYIKQVVIILWKIKRQYYKKSLPGFIILSGSKAFLTCFIMSTALPSSFNIYFLLNSIKLLVSGSIDSDNFDSFSEDEISNLSKIYLKASEYPSHTATPFTIAP